jgi:hypothetical protein
MLESLHSFVAKLRGRSGPWGNWTISLHETGFRVRPPRQQHAATSFDWQDITAVVAFKRDGAAYDLIWLAVADNNTIVEINEEDIGWNAFTWAIEKYLSGSVPRQRWWPVVTQPPHAATIVYSKE